MTQDYLQEHLERIAHLDDEIRELDGERRELRADVLDHMNQSGAKNLQIGGTAINRYTRQRYDSKKIKDLAGYLSMKQFARIVKETISHAAVARMHSNCGDELRAILDDAFIRSDDYIRIARGIQSDQELHEAFPDSDESIDEIAEQDNQRPRALGGRLSAKGREPYYGPLSGAWRDQTPLDTDDRF